MRHILAAVAAIAVGGVLATTSARAEPVYEPGGPVQVGGYCIKVTDASGFGLAGYYAPCPTPEMHIMKRHRKMK
jgi:hypothetical protein